MAWYALVPPRTWVQDATGACLRYAQSFFGAPVRHRSAWHAWAAAPGHAIGRRITTEVPLPGMAATDLTGILE